MERADEQTKRAAKTLFEKLDEAVLKRPGGKSAIRADVMRAACLEAGQDAVAAVALACAELGHVSRGYHGLALTLAGVYQALFGGDDSLTRKVRRTLETKGVKDVFIDFENESPEQEKLIHLSVNQEMLADADAYVLFRLFSIERAASEAEQLRWLRGRCAITFEVDSDPRPVWLIPEVRVFVKKLHDAIPHLPYFLEPHPEGGMLITHFFPLAAPSVTTEDGVDIGHASVVAPLVRSLRATGALAAQLGDDPMAVCRGFLAPLPQEHQDYLLSRAGLGGR